LKNRHATAWTTEKLEEFEIMKVQYTLEDIIEDLVAVEPLILNYEKKYKVRTPDFYRLYKQGKLEERWDLYFSSITKEGLMHINEACYAF
jgi:hypothetical protein